MAKSKRHPTKTDIFSLCGLFCDYNYKFSVELNFKTTFGEVLCE